MSAAVLPVPADSIQPKLQGSMNSKSIYTRIYNNLIEKGKGLKEEWKPGSGLERHHIIPRHQGGTDDESNFAYLTRREHIAVHFLLWKINGHIGDRYAYRMMCNFKSYPTQHTEESKQRISEALKGKKKGPMSEEHKQKISEGQKGKKLSEETKQRISELHKGRKLSEEHKRKLSDSMKGKKLGPRSEESKRKQSESMKKRWAKRKK